MKTAERVSSLVGRWFAVIVLAAGAIALLTPETFAPGTSAIQWLLALIMLGMGMTLQVGDFVIVAKRPWALLLGVTAQYLVMPLAGYGLAVALDLPPALAAGMVLVGAAPGGTASNVMVYLSRGDTALSVAMTTVSTLLAPLLTPAIVLLLGDEFLPVDAGALFTSILQIVLAPVLIGLLLRTFAGRLVEHVLPVLPMISVGGITAVVMIVVGASAGTLLSVGLVLVVAVVLHNGIGLGLGYAIAKACRLDVPGRRAVSIEVGMQNSGLAAALAAAHFNPVAALPAAIFSVWHNVSGSVLASYWSRGGEPTEVAAEGMIAGEGGR
ncbi:Bile acid:sodium symporter [Pseudonocardia sp. CNS-004]|nr:Bile acid:sodium symporter [Pseudonocardia sp. CNS-004]